MKPESVQKLGKIACMYSQIQNHATTLSGNTAGIVYMFFASQFSIPDISEIYELPPAQINRMVTDFLADLLTNSSALRESLGCRSVRGGPGRKVCIDQGDTNADLKSKAKLLIGTCEIPDSLGYWVRGAVGTALCISGPTVPSDLGNDIISRVQAVTGPAPGKIVEFPAKLREPDFVLGKLKMAASVEFTSLAKTCTDGSVLIERGTESVKVDFRIALQKGLGEEYTITFRNLPSWAIPVSFSFVGPDDLGALKEYKLPSAFREGRLYFRIENKAQKEAFLDCTDVYIGFTITEHSKG